MSYHETVHRLKTEPQFWDAVDRREKRFEIRKNDRNYQRGDTLDLRRMPEGVTTHRIGQDPTEEWPSILRRISYVLAGPKFGLEAGYVILSLEEV